MNNIIKRTITKDEVSVIVSKMLKHQRQEDHNRVLEMILELDKASTQNALESEKMKADIIKIVHELERRQSVNCNTGQEKCQCVMKEKFDVVNEKIDENKPNYIAIIGLILMLFIPFLGWIYSIQVTLWDLKVNVATIDRKLENVSQQVKQVESSVNLKK